jgi:hypothetical protein
LPVAARLVAARRVAEYPAGGFNLKSGGSILFARTFRAMRGRQDHLSSASANSLSASLLARITPIVVVVFAILVVSSGPANAQQSPPNSTQTAQPAAPNSTLPSPRGIKLMLKDGTFQLVREYQVMGDRVRYYSIDRSNWEEIPASLVDWAATKKQENETAQFDASLVKKVRRQEDQRRIMPLEVDASLEVSPGVFLPSGAGVFLFNNKRVLQLAPTDPEYKTDKAHEIERVMSPVPMVSSRQTVLLKGAHAKVRIDTERPEFYVRISADDPPISLQLVKAEIHGSTRKIARVDALFKMQNATVHPLLMQRWQIAKDVYRFTLGQTLTPGEYALVQVISESTDMGQLSINVWDFGVNESGGEQ